MSGLPHILFLNGKAVRHFQEPDFEATSGEILLLRNFHSLVRQIAVQPWREVRPAADRRDPEDATADKRRTFAAGRLRAAVGQPRSLSSRPSSNRCTASFKMCTMSQTCARNVACPRSCCRSFAGARRSRARSTATDLHFPDKSPSRIAIRLPVCAFIRTHWTRFGLESSSRYQGRSRVESCSSPRYNQNSVFKHRRCFFLSLRLA